MIPLRLAYCWCCVWLLPAAGCGRIGVRGFALDAGLPGYVDASSARDAGLGGSNGGYMQGDRGGSGGSSAARDAGAVAGRGPSAGMDGSIPLDASTAMDAATAACGGAVVFGLCWYLASEDTSCSTECADKGGYDSRAAAYVGTPIQGGSQAECMQIFAALGRSGPVVPAVQQLGLGCHMWSDGTLYWLQSPAFNANAAAPSSTGARIVCACQR